MTATAYNRQPRSPWALGRRSVRWSLRGLERPEAWAAAAALARAARGGATCRAGTAAIARAAGRSSRGAGRRRQEAAMRAGLVSEPLGLVGRGRLVLGLDRASSYVLVPNDRGDRMDDVADWAWPYLVALYGLMPADGSDLELSRAECQAWLVGRGCRWAAGDSGWRRLARMRREIHAAIEDGRLTAIERVDDGRGGRGKRATYRLAARPSPPAPKGVANGREVRKPRSTACIAVESARARGGHRGAVLRSLRLIVGQSDRRRSDNPQTAGTKPRNRGSGPEASRWRAQAGTGGDSRGPGVLDHRLQLRSDRGREASVGDELRRVDEAAIRGAIGPPEAEEAAAAGEVPARNRDGTPVGTPWADRRRIVEARLENPEAISWSKLIASVDAMLDAKVPPTGDPLPVIPDHEPDVSGREVLERLRGAQARPAPEPAARVPRRTGWREPLPTIPDHGADRSGRDVLDRMRAAQESLDVMRQAQTGGGDAGPP